MFKKVFGLFGFGCDEVKVQVEALLQEVALLKEDLNNLSTKVVDHVEESKKVEVDYGSIADNISYSQLASIIDISDLVKEIYVDPELLASNVDIQDLADNIDMFDLVRRIHVDYTDLASNIEIDDIADKVFEKFLEKVKNID